MSSSDCVMYGMCSEDQYCIANHPPKSTATDIYKKVCNLDSPEQCCDRTQLTELENKLGLLAMLVRDSTDDPTCYDGLLNIFCEITCSPQQSDLVKILSSDSTKKTVTSIDFRISRPKAQKIFDACAKIDAFFGRAIDYICKEEKCDMQAFFRSLGSPSSKGGQSPYEINFVYEDSATDHVQFTDVDSVDNDEITTTPPPALRKEESPCLTSRFFKRPLWLGMILTFLSLTLVFLLGLAIRWCIERWMEDNAGASAGSYTPPIGCYSKVGATIQFGSTWLFSRQGALVARFPKLTLLITAILLGITCCGFICFRVTTDPVDLWSDPNSRARLEKAYFDEHFGLVYQSSFSSLFFQNLLIS
ncbi:unnamed protein product [Rodentolepis nana]|uniref:NPC1_N domain-containing protein n=1 Tax=Rodentolepis nana TaxID=102285 RepID=A0A0R3TAC0_RODNA|nr:unnamed protein product [Rodentolepis nana]